jgi:hypothetical protein
MSEKIYKGYLKIGFQYFLQIPDPSSRWGFQIYDDDQAWDGGIGLFNLIPRIPVKESKVPKEDRERLGWILKEPT